MPRTLRDITYRMAHNMTTPSWILSSQFEGYLKTAAELAPESLFSNGHTIRSSRSDAPNLAAYRTTCSTPDLDISLRLGGRNCYLLRLYLTPLPASALIKGDERINIGPQSAMQSSIYDGRDTCVWATRSAFDMITFEIPRSTIKTLGTPQSKRPHSPAPLPSAPNTDDTIGAFGLAALQIIERPSEFTQYYVDHLLDGVCSYLAKIYFHRKPETHASSGLAGWQERRAKDFMQASIGEGLSIKSIADECGLSVGHFTRAFKRSTGYSPYKWLLQQRLELARKLLGEDNSLAEIAARCGFSDQSHLTNAFCRRMGMPPGAFRKLNFLKARGTAEDDSGPINNNEKAHY